MTNTRRRFAADAAGAGCRRAGSRARDHLDGAGWRPDGGAAPAPAQGSHRHHRQHPGRADAVRRLAGDDAPRAFSEARAGRPQPRVQRRRGHHAAALEELRLAGRVAERTRRAGWRLPGQPPRWRQHEGGRHLRVLRLQRVLRGAGRTEHVPEAARRLAHPYAGAEVQRQVGPSRRALFADRAREPGQSGSPGRRREQPAAGALHARRWPTWPRPRGVTFVDLFAPSKQLYAVERRAAHDPGHPPERRRQPAHQPGRSTGRCSASRRPTSRRCSNGCGRR